MTTTTDLKPRSIKVTEQEWRRWQTHAASEHLTLSALIRRLVAADIRRAERRER